MNKWYFGSILLIFLFSCGNKKKEKAYVEHKGYAAGTDYLIEYEANAGNLNIEINQLLAEIDRSVVASNPASVISTLNANDSGGISNKHITYLYQLSMDIFKETQHSFDPTIQPVIDWWGKDVRKFVYPELVDSSIIDSLRSYTGFTEVYNSGGVIKKKRGNININFNRVYEGYLADQVSELLDGYNVSSYRIEIGGKLKAKGNDQLGKPWQVGLDEPTNDPKKRPLMALAKLNGNGFAIAGSYRDFYTKGQMKLPFTIDPVTLKPVNHTLMFAAVFAPTAVEAEAYANAFIVIGEEKTKTFLTNHPQLDAYLISTNYKGEWVTYLSNGLAEKVEFVNEAPR